MLWEQKRIQAVENNIADKDEFYKLIKAPCMKWKNTFVDFNLHPVEVFYHCFYTIDWFFSEDNNLEEARDSCTLNLWQDLIDYFREKTNCTNDGERDKCIAIILYCVAKFLDISGDQTFNSIISALSSQIQLHVGEFYVEIDREFQNHILKRRAERCQQYAVEYIQSDRTISVEIGTVLDSIDAEVEQQVAAPSSIRIADNRKTAIINILAMMYDSHWFTDANGNTLVRSRDKTIQEILRHAFCDDNTTDNIKSLISSSKNRNKEKGPIEYLYELGK